MTGAVAQVVEHLFCKLKALSSNTSPTKRKKGGREEKRERGKIE
jgi:hypothetical protein